MIEQKLTPVTQRIMARAQIEAESVGKDAIEPTHLLLGILQEGRSAAALLLQQKQIIEQECRDADFKK
jgi:ATP-dependent Clp protease ATP-binding subunit ClpA